MKYSPRNFWLLCGLGFAAIVAAHLLPHAVRGNGLWSVPAIGFAALMLLGAGFFFVSYGTMDDVQKQNLKSDWYWGSAIGSGLLIGMVFPAVLFGSAAENLAGLFHRTATPNGYFFCGVMVTLVLFMLGYFAVYLVRRLREMKG